MVRRRNQPVNKLRRKANCRTKKAGFHTEEDALEYIKDIRNRKGQGSSYLPTRTYPCKLCTMWHITSEAYREDA